MAEGDALLNRNTIKFKEENEEDMNKSLNTFNKKSFTKEQKCIFCVAFTANLFAFSLISLPAPFLPIVDESHNILSDLTGWILGIFSLVQLILFPVFGKVIHRIGVRRTLLCGELLCGVLVVTFGLLEYLPVPDPTDNSVDVTYLVLAIVMRILQAIGASAYTTAAMTLLTTAFPEDTIVMLGYGELATASGIAIGPTLGGLLFKLGGFMTVFGGVGGLLLLANLISYFILPADGHTNKKEEKPSTTLLEILKYPNVILSLVITFFFGMSCMMLYPILEPEIRSKFGLTEDISAFIFLTIPACYLISAPLSSRFRKNFRNFDTLYCLAIELLLDAGVLILIGPSPLIPGLQRPLWVLIVTLAFHSLFTEAGIIFSLELAFIPTETETSELKREMNTATQSLVSGVWLTAFSFGEFISPVLSGFLVKNLNFGWTTTTYSGMYLVLAVVVLLVKAYRITKSSYRKPLSEIDPLLE